MRIRLLGLVYPGLTRHTPLLLVSLSGSASAVVCYLGRGGARSQAQADLHAQYLDRGSG